MKGKLSFEFHISRAARERYQFVDALFTLTGNVVFADLKASREFAHRMNLARDVERHPERAVHPGALNAMALIDEALHAVAALYRQQRDPKAMVDAVAWFRSRIGEQSLDQTLLAFAEHFPTVAVYRGEQTAADWLAASTEGVSHRAVALEELMMLWLANVNTAFRSFHELFDQKELAAASAYSKITAALRDYFGTRPRFGPENQNLVDMLRAPALASPDSLEGQLAFIRDRWADLLGDFLQRMLMALDVLKEEDMAIWMRFHPPEHHHFGGALTWGDSSAAAIPHFRGAEHEYERFSPDQHWMPRTVMMAKSAYVWLDQISKTHQRHVHRLDQIPDEELDLLARRGFNGLWLIGVWERSRASQRIKQLCGNAEAVASAYSLRDYAIAEDLGGEAAYVNLRNRAWARGIRLASDMVPNHMGIDSRWMIEHPDWFLSLPYSPYPSYSFHGPDLSSDGRVEIKIDDHYFNRTDAAVVFQRRDRWTGDTRYIYHGNDGTSFPWNDTAQLNYLNPEVREAVIQTILHVARMFPIIRFDAAMTLAKRHYQRLWFPEPGTGGAIPSRAEHGLSKAAFDAAMPEEFWREVVDRVAAEVPDTLLLAEAFWFMEGYFVRTLGMHRVYNSAFMNMLRDEENANYRSVIKNTLTFDPEVLKRYVNFMNNPDERTAVDQFGKGDKYFGICTMMVTLPGLPMFGHGQIEGYSERYGMEYRRAYYDEQPDSWLVARHEREIVPLLHRRHLFAEVHEFLLYDFYADDGHVNENVFAFSNCEGDERALVVYHNRYAHTRGWIRVSAAYADKAHGNRLRQRTLGESFQLSTDLSMFVTYRDALTGLSYLQRTRDLAERGLCIDLGAYKCYVFVEWRDLHDDGTHPWGMLCDTLAGSGVASLEDAMRELQLKPVRDALRAVVDPALAEALTDCLSKPDGVKTKARILSVMETARHRAGVLLAETERYVSSGAGRTAGLAPEQKWKGSREDAEQVFLSRLRAALCLATLDEQTDELPAWPEEARAVLPVDHSLRQQAIAIWSTMLAWCAVEAIGYLRDPEQQESASTQLFDALRLREPLGEAFAAAGLVDEERWRAASRLRASFAHGSPAMAPFGWLHDPDVAWVVGIHEYEDVSYLVKEKFERLLWWLNLRALLEIADGEPLDLEKLLAVQKQIKTRMLAAEAAGYRVETLEQAGRKSEVRR
jgi:glycosidase